MVSGPFDRRASKWWFGLEDDDVKIAIQAAHQTADRLNKPIALQIDLSVVPEEQATMEILEVITPVGYHRDA
jgi:hypothetical protein